MLESFVDLTYRGLSLGRRIRLSQVRPSAGTLELPAPMPVGTQIAIATDDGVTFDVTVTWIHEQVGGSDRPPGMTVAPALATAPAAAWWSERVALPDDEVARSRAATALDAQVAAAAGSAPGRSAADVHDALTIVMPVVELPAEAFPEGGSAGEPAVTPTAPAEPAAMGPTGEHDVIDDGNHTMIMAQVDLATLGLELGATADPEATSDATAADGDDEADASDAGEPTTIPDASPLQPSSRGRKKRKLRR